MKTGEGAHYQPLKVDHAYLRSSKQRFQIQIQSVSSPLRDGADQDVAWIGVPPLLVDLFLSSSRRLVDKPGGIARTAVYTHAI